MGSSYSTKLFLFILVTSVIAMAQDSSPPAAACVTVTGADVGVDSTSRSEIKVTASGAVSVEGDLGFRKISTGISSAIVVPKDPNVGYRVVSTDKNAKVCRETASAPSTRNAPSASDTNPPESSAPLDSGSSGGNSAVSEKSNSASSNSSAGASGTDSSTKQPDCLTSGLASGVSPNCDLNGTINGLAAPETPAFTVLGITPKVVSRPQAPSELAAALAQGFDDRGNFQSGVAIDAVPFLWIAAHNFALSQYAQSGIQPQLIRWGARTSVSFASAKGASDSDKSVRLGLGMRSVLWQKNDPHTVFYECVNRLDPTKDPTKKFQPGDDVKFEAQVKDCEAESVRKVWNSSSFVIAAAPSWISIPGTSTGPNPAIPTGYRRNGGGYWASFAWGVTEAAQITLNAQRRTGEMVPDQTAAGTSASGGGTPTPAFLDQASTVFGGQLRYGSPDVNGVFEGLSVHKKIAGSVQDYAQYGLGLEKKISSALFLDLSYRWAPGTTLGSSGVLGNLNWSFNQKPQLAPQ